MKSTRRKHSKKVHSRRRSRNHRDGNWLVDNLTKTFGSQLAKLELELKELEDEKVALTKYLSESEISARKSGIQKKADEDEEKEIKKNTSKQDSEKINSEKNLESKLEIKKSKDAEVQNITEYINNRSARLEAFNKKEEDDEKSNTSKVKELNEQIKTLNTEIQQIQGEGKDKIQKDYDEAIKQIKLTAKTNRNSIEAANVRIEEETNKGKKIRLDLLNNSEISKKKGEVETEKSRVAKEKANKASVKKDGKRRKRSRSLMKSHKKSHDGKRRKRSRSAKKSHKKSHDGKRRKRSISAKKSHKKSHDGKRRKRSRSAKKSNW